MTATKIAIVGSSYQAEAAQTVLNGLPNGTRLFLRAQPDNPVDPNAIGVFCHISTIYQRLDPMIYSTLERELKRLAGDGLVLRLGWVPRRLAARMKIERDLPAILDQEGPFAVVDDTR